MIDHILGRPSPSWKRTQVFLVVLFWAWRVIRAGNVGPPRIFGIRRANKVLQRFSPWQIILSTLTTLYALRNIDKIMGLSAPEPLARLYSPSYYRATWIATGLDAGFATALSIRPKWLRDICSLIFSVYYIIYAHEADEKLRRFRAVPTVEMLRATWEKTTNPYIRFFTSLSLPSLDVRRKILLPRPKHSNYQRPITAYLFYALPPEQLVNASELVLDYPGGGFICMNPEHHEDRLRLWAKNIRRPILSIDYGKAPEYPYPFAIDEAFDVYRLLVESNGAVIGMSGNKLDIVLSGDSAGGAMAVNVVIKTLEHNASNPATQIPLPTALLLNYPALDFNFGSWMSQDNLRILRSEQSTGHLPGLVDQKDHLSHKSPLSMVDDSSSHSTRKHSRKGSLRGSIRGQENDEKLKDAPPITGPRPRMKRSTSALRTHIQEDSSDENLKYTDGQVKREEDKPVQDRILYYHPQVSNGEAVTGTQQQRKLSAAVVEADQKMAMAKSYMKNERRHAPIGMRLTLTSRSGYFQDRIVTPSMMRAMALLYVGPYRNPDFATNYYISPLLAPATLLAKFPPLLLFCGEADPFNDDSILLAGRVREAKRSRKIELDLALSGKSARFGEDLRMSVNEPMSVEDADRMRKERDSLSNEEDWVQLTLFAGWSHGYLQMATLMHEAKAVIEDQADCIEDAFSRWASGKATTTLNAPFTAEPEADDFGITFVPKKYQDGNLLGGPFDTEEPPEAREENGDLKPSYGVPRTPGGQKISEEELMRRRRLLDAHIFE